MNPESGVALSEVMQKPETSPYPLRGEVGISMPDITDVDMSFSDNDVKAYVDGNTQFYLTAPLTQAEDVSASFSSKMKVACMRGKS